MSSLVAEPSHRLGERGELGVAAGATRRATEGQQDHVAPVAPQRDGTSVRCHQPELRGWYGCGRDPEEGRIPSEDEVGAEDEEDRGERQK